MIMNIATADTKTPMQLVELYNFAITQGLGVFASANGGGEFIVDVSTMTEDVQIAFELVTGKIDANIDFVYVV